MVICIAKTNPCLQNLGFPTSKRLSSSSPSPLLHFQGSLKDPNKGKKRRRLSLPPSKTFIIKLKPHGNSSIRDYPVSTVPVNKSNSSVAGREMWALCGIGYWVQGFRCFPWLALNFHMVQRLGLSPSTLQLVQNSGNLPMVAKPLYGVISDAVYIGGAHRLPYISIGVFLQVLSWGTLAIIPATGDTFPTQMACILLSNFGASITEVVSDALVAEFSRYQKAGELQSYAFIVLAVGAILGNLTGGFVLLRSQEPKIMFCVFAFLLSVQLFLSMITKEPELYDSRSLNHLGQNSVADNLRKQSSELITAISEEKILYPLAWAVVSTAIVPILSGSIFCFQMQQLKLDPSIIGMSRVFGQLMVLSATLLYNRYLKKIALRTLITGVQVFYAFSLLLDLVLVKQINLKLGISNEIFVLCLSALAEAVAQFKILPFTVLFSHLCPAGCEGSLFAFFSSALCFSSIVSGIFGVGLSTLIGVNTGDYSMLPIGIMCQFVAALLPLGWISCIPTTENVDMVKKSKGRLLAAG